MHARFLFLQFILPLAQILLAVSWFIEEPVAFASQSPQKVNAQVNPSGSKLHYSQAVPYQLVQNQPSPDLKLLLSGTVPPRTITSRTPSPISMTLPSLWWVAEQIANFEKYGPKLIQDWIAYPAREGETGQVDLLVNRQLWSLLDYLQRYELVSRFSAIARSYGYNTRVYDNPDRPPVASYTCRFEDIPLQKSIGDRAFESAIEDYMGREEMADRMTCNLDLAPFNRPGRLNPSTVNQP